MIPVIFNINISLSIFNQTCTQCLIGQILIFQSSNFNTLTRTYDKIGWGSLAGCLGGFPYVWTLPVRYLMFYESELNNYVLAIIFLFNCKYYEYKFE